MFGRRFQLFKIFGFQISVDPSWFVIFALVSWSLAVQYFPGLREDLVPATAWVMGVAGALLFFASIVLHEVSHALMARRYGLPIKGITLFIFGGVAEMTDEPPTPQAEFMVAVAGPIATVLITAVAFVVATVGSGLGWPFAVTGVAQVVALLNGMLALFNIVPAFPLDGGRMMRSLLWHWKDNLRWATRVTSSIGSVFGAVLIGVGVMLLLFTDSSGGGWINGIWFALIGLFLRNAARMSYQQLLLRRALEGEPVSRFMQPDPVAVPRAVSVKELVEDYVYRHHYKLFPVVDGDRLVGCVTTREVKGLPREEWDRQTVGSIATACTPENAVDPATDAMQALGTMSRNGISRLMVVDGGRLVGILTLKDLLKFFSLKMELESPA
jgi:Zn-dependent protease/CBS domain-containing protein